MKVIPFSLERTEWEPILGDYVEYWTARIPASNANSAELISYTAEAWDTIGDKAWAVPHVYEVGGCLYQHPVFQQVLLGRV